MLALGIETSCDDTCVAVVTEQDEVLANVKTSQDNLHQKYQGVVPEVASRGHLEYILPCVEEALHLANISFKDIALIGVTKQPGLIGSLLVGLNVAKALGLLLRKPVLGVNHLLGHLYSLRFDNAMPYPFLGLIVSGGHTLLTRVTSPLYAKIIGSTLDDACGEAFDKIAKFFGLPYPGGAVIEKRAKTGDVDAFAYPVSDLPRAKGSYCFSYSGLKTAVLHQSKKYQKTKTPSLEDTLASFQKAAILSLYTQTKRAANDLEISHVGICGGVAVNGFLRKYFVSDPNWKCFFPSGSYCTDNAAMIAGLALTSYKADKKNKTPLDPILNSFKGRIGEVLY